MADASWGERNIYACLVMMNNGVIVAETKKMGPVDSSAEAEGIATSKCAEIPEGLLLSGGLSWNAVMARKTIANLAQQHVLVRTARLAGATKVSS